MDVHADGALSVVPAPELQLLRAPEPFVTAPDERTPLPRSYDLTVTAGTRTTVGLLRSTDGTELTVVLDPDEGRVTVDRGVGGAAPVIVRAPARQVRILADGSLLEVFVDDRATVTERIYRRDGDVPELTVTGAGATVIGWEHVPPAHS